ncbi:MAG: hypothetical protein IKN55_11580, partial [Oscillospiraceae bacterium]|nr:hypothetical protein [Oscillospiraceae bacterium]
MKQTLACLMAAALLVPGLPVMAEGEETASPAEDTAAAENAAEDTAEDVQETISVEEEAEEFMCSVEEVEQYLDLVGECDGYAVYLRPEDYKERIEAQTAKAYPDEDAAKDARKEIEKHLKPVELALIDTETHKMAAELEQIEKSKEEVVYFSDAGHYLVFLNADKNKVNRIRFRVSTLDSEYLFLTKDQETLELYSTDYKELRASLKKGSTADKKTAFHSADNRYHALLSEALDQVYYCVREGAENDKLRMYYDEDTAMIGLMNKETGYIWWSSPLEANRDTRATRTLVTDLQSSAVLTYGDAGSRGVTNLRSRNQSEIRIKELDDGITVSYEFSKAGITIPVSYRLEDDHLAVSVRTADIKETKTAQGISATQLTLLGSFGAAGPEEEGYFVIPDGCGALIRFNNGKASTKSYSARVYGRDITTVPTTRPPVTEKLLMPVYGIVKQDNAMAVIVEKGDGNVTLNASVSGQSLSSYNICSFNYMLRGSDTFYMPGDYGTLTVFEDGPIKAEELRVRYYPLTAEAETGYMQIAQTYRDYLLGDGGVTEKTQPDTAELYLDLYGGCMKNRSVLGVPVTVRTSMTSFDEAKEIVSGLHDSGVDKMVVVYNQWTNEGISGKVDNKAAPSGTLGGSSAFKRLSSYLSEQGDSFYPAVNNKEFRSGNGYYSFFNTTIRISNAYSRQMRYNLSYGVQDTSKKTLPLLSPGTFTELYGKLAAAYSKKNIGGVCFGEMTSTLWGDYGKQNMGREDTMHALQESYQTVKNAGVGMLSDTCAAYAFPYTDRITDVPLQSSRFDVFDEDIPFYQIVMHGVVPYSGTAINASADSRAAFLTSVATGCNPAFDMIYAEASDLKDTDFDRYFYSHYAFWTDTAAEEYRIAKEVLSGVSDQKITNYTRSGDVSVTTFENGTEITVDYANETITSGGRTWSLGEKGGAGQ